VLKAAVLLWPKEGKEEEEVEQLAAAISIQCTLRQHRAARACIQKIRARRKKREEDLLAAMFNSHDDDGNGIMEFSEFESLMKMLDPDLPTHLYGKLYADTLEIAENLANSDGAMDGTRSRANSSASISDDDDDDDADDVPVTAEVWILVGPLVC
jgi:succinate dehydrogenase flavin-adding protein (antitoxin of CptAB toxin-antitoxin module)